MPKVLNLDGARFRKDAVAPAEAAATPLPQDLLFLDDADLLTVATDALTAAVRLIGENRDALCSDAGERKDDALRAVRAKIQAATDALAGVAP